MTPSCKKIFLLDDHAWRRRAFADSLMSLGTGCRVETAELTGTTHHLADEADRLVVVVLGGQPLAAPQSEAMIRSLAAKVGNGGLAVICEAVTGDCIALALRLGLRGILTTGMQLGMLEATLNFLLAGGTYIPHSETLPAGSDMAAGYLPPPVPAPAEPVVTTADDQDAAEQLDEKIIAALTRRQRDVAVALAIGASNKEIARELNLSESTVKTHIRQIMRKFDASNRTQAALKAQAIARFSAARDSATPMSRFG